MILASPPPPTLRHAIASLARRIAVVTVVLAAVSCHAKHGTSTLDGDGTAPLATKASGPGATTSFGDPLPGLTGDETSRFAVGRAAFSAVESVADGLGPVFNGTSCGGCHGSPVVGGGSAQLETRFGTITAGVFDPLTTLGGSLIQSQGIGVITAGGSTCDFVGEVVPSAATIRAQRMTTPLFGLGLVDAVPDSTFVALASTEAHDSPSTAGQPALVTNIATGKLAVGKFGWKAQVPTLFQFAGDAYVNEMGITNPLFPTENCPQGNCALLVCDPVPIDPEDDGADIDAFTDFMSVLAPPPPGASTPGMAAGKAKFEHIGCTNCHTSQLQTGPSAAATLDHKTFSPYSDFLLHDMGSLGDGITQAAASGTQMRTAPLWGAYARTRYLHDGRAANVHDAIMAHDGQGAAARNAFAALPPPQQKHLLDYINSL